MFDAQNIFYALLGAIIPALIWLFFWLMEDARHPEPRRLILRSFIFGMASVALVLPLQLSIDSAFPGMTLTAITLWAGAEEILKFTAAFFGGLITRAYNEPVDAIIYLITAALGFVAAENFLFILGPLSNGEIVQSIITGNTRFIGASLLHVVASGLIGASIAFSYHKKVFTKTLVVFLALISATLFHIIFNILLLDYAEMGGIIAFSMVWVGVIVLFILFEKAKTIAR